MSADIDKRLANLSLRRNGRDRATMTFDSVASLESLKETYQERATGKNTRYALGAMQEVGKQYTDKGIEEAGRVQARINDGLAKEGLHCTFKLQGSVPGNIHIRGASDVDFLVLDPRFIKYDASGPGARQGYYREPYLGSPLATLQSLRASIEQIIINAYPAATVDCSGGKAIQVSGGSLDRDIDVVTASWFDTPEYQSTRNEDFRGVDILDKKVPALIRNAPFLHLLRLKERDAETWGGLKKAIRLCKTLKADAANEGTHIDINSYDIASALWNADADSLRAGIIDELSILSAATRYFLYLASNLTHARNLQTPNGLRQVFDTEDKLKAIPVLAQELVELAKSVAQEQAPLLERNAQFEDWMGTLKRAKIPQ